MGGLAGGFTGFLTTPLDLAKTKLMTQTNAAASQQYDDTDLGYRSQFCRWVSILSRQMLCCFCTSVQYVALFRYGSYMEVVFDILKKEGVSGLFRGASARVIWLIPFTAIYFGVHEKTKRTLLNRYVLREMQQTLLQSLPKKDGESLSSFRLHYLSLRHCICIDVSSYLRKERRAVVRVPFVPIPNTHPPLALALR